MTAQKKRGYAGGKGIVKTTPTNLAEGFRAYSKLCLQRYGKANEDGRRPDDPELVSLYAVYVFSVQSLRESAKRYLRKKLPAVPVWTNDGYRKNMSQLAQYCSDCAERLQSSGGKLPLAARALMVFTEDPDLPMTQIADKLGVHRQRLYEEDCHLFREARRKHQADQVQSRLENIPKGTKTDGEQKDKMEAWK